MLACISITSTSFAQVTLITRDEIPQQEEQPARTPEQIADSIVTFIPDRDYALHIPPQRDYFLDGSMEVTFGEIPEEIVIPAQSMIRDLVKGESYRVYLVAHPIYKTSYYPIAIYPSTAEVEQ